MLLLEINWKVKISHVILWNRYSFAPPQIVEKEIENNWLYREVADIWSKWLPPDTKETIMLGGYYTVLVRPGFRIIAMNSNVVFSLNWLVTTNDNKLYFKYIYTIGFRVDTPVWNCFCVIHFVILIYMGHLQRCC